MYSHIIASDTFRDATEAQRRDPTWVQGIIDQFLDDKLTIIWVYRVFLRFLDLFKVFGHPKLWQASQRIQDGYKILFPAKANLLTYLVMICNGLLDQPLTKNMADKKVKEKRESAIRAN